MPTLEEIFQLSVELKTERYLDCSFNFVTGVVTSYLVEAFSSFVIEIFINDGIDSEAVRYWSSSKMLQLDI